MLSLKEPKFKLLLSVFCLQKNMSALHYVAQHGFDREASLLLEAGINVDAVNNVCYVNSNVSCVFVCMM